MRVHSALGPLIAISEYYFHLNSYYAHQLAKIIHFLVPKSFIYAHYPLLQNVFHNPLSFINSYIQFSQPTIWIPEAPPADVPAQRMRQPIITTFLYPATPFPAIFIA